jgi:hypothetical protein
LLLVFSAATLATAARSAPSSGAIELDVGVRSEVDKPESFKSSPPPEHGRLFYIAAVQEYKSQEKLVRPVDENGMLRALRQELKARGFREQVKKEKPDIVLTVAYGRGWLTNPYAVGGSTTDTMAGTTQTIWSADPKGIELLINMRAKSGYEAKMQKADFEKLYIHVTAWQYPPPNPKKPKKLWKTVMVVDDPDHRDLNSVYKEMLAAGSAFFDRETTEPEVDVYKPLPEGHVRVGPVEVVEPAKAKSP